MQEISAGDMGSIPGLGGSPVERNGNPFQYSCLENSMASGSWWAMVHGVTKELNTLSDETTPKTKRKRSRPLLNSKIKSSAFFSESSTF